MLRLASVPRLLINRTVLSQSFPRRYGDVGEMSRKYTANRSKIYQTELLANKRAHDPAVQEALYSALLRTGHVSNALQRYRTGLFASNETIDRWMSRASNEDMGTYPLRASSASSASTGASDSSRFAFPGMNSGTFSTGGSGATGGASGSGMPRTVYFTTTADKRSVLWFIVRNAVFIVVLYITFGLVSKGAGSSLAGVGNKQFDANVERVDTKFDDVKGCDEAKEELSELVQFLKDPSAFTRLGGKLPHGVLLTGPPGTGKTLLAKAVAGEANVPFFSCSGSDFEEMFVGVGAARIRALFQKARSEAPCIVFIDEIDAVGSKRRARDTMSPRMTLNQLLTEMDGFQTGGPNAPPVIVIAATNAPDALDKALTRPGRLDKHVAVPLPDVKGRTQILQLYLKQVKADPSIDASVIARGTPGVSGAQLFNIVNIAALKAGTEAKKFVTAADLEYAKDKVLMGAERASAVLSEKCRTLTSYHEAGHALVALNTQGAHPVHKATILPRGSSLGSTHQLPVDDVLTETKQELMAELDVLMGGRAAEELVYGPENVTTGASSDFKQATRIARRMVTRYGMGSGTVALASLSDEDLEALSSDTKQAVDDSASELLGAAYSRASTLLSSKQTELHNVARALLKHETLTGADLTRAAAGEPITISISSLD